MKELTVVKIYDGKIKKIQREYYNYSLALEYVMKQVDLGYSGILERLDNGKVWAKVKFYPRETM